MSTKQEQDNLVVNNLGLAKMITNKLWRKYPPIRYKFDTWEDAYQTGLIELMKAARDFDPNKGFKFTSLAGTYIENKLVNCCRTRKKDSIKFVNDTDLGTDTRFDDNIGFISFYEVVNTDPRSSQDIDNYDNTEEVEYLLSRCNNEQKELLREYFYEGKSYRQMGEGSEATKQRCRTRIIACIKRLKELKCLQYA